MGLGAASKKLLKKSGGIAKKIILKPIVAYENKLKKMDEYRRTRNRKMIEDNFGSMRNYDEHLRKNK